MLILLAIVSFPFTTKKALFTNQLTLLFKVGKSKCTEKIIKKMSQPKNQRLTCSSFSCFDEKKSNFFVLLYTHIRQVEEKTKTFSGLIFFCYSPANDDEV